MHYKAQETIVFYVMASIFVLIFVLGFVGVVHLWLLGGAKREDTEVRAPKFVVSLLKAGFFQTQILDYSVLAWLAHLLISLGFFALFLLTAFHFVLIWFVPSTSDFFLYFKSGVGNLILAAWGDFWGILLLIGLVLAIFRRYVFKPQQLNTMGDDSMAIFFLLVVTVSGFTCEALRLAARPESPDSGYSFVVNWAVPFLKAQHPSEALVGAFFWLHVILSFLFIAYMPFGKLRHILASPLVYALVTSNGLYTKVGRLRRASHEESLGVPGGGTTA